MGYLSSGSCTGLLGMFVLFPRLMLALTLAGAVSYVQQEAPGRLMGTQAVLQATQDSLDQTHPELKAKVGEYAEQFTKMHVDLTEDEIRYVLSLLEPCTDATVKDVLSDPDLRRDVAWLYYLDLISREGPQKATLDLSNKHGSPPPHRR